jgi:hypothetical protein
MQYLFHTPIPLPWLLADLLTVAITVTVIVFLVKRGKHPASLLLEGFGFVFLYAAVFENFAVVQGWYIYGCSLLMIGDVPLSVPLIEMDVLFVGLWLLEKMQIPNWCKPFVVGLFGMLQDFSLDPVATHQIFSSQGITSGHWTWLTPEGAVNIHGIPVYNFPGWMLIMLYGSAFILLGREWFKRSGYKPSVGIIYPLLGTFLALVAMVSPLSQFLLWLGPIGAKGTNFEWGMLAFHLLFPSILLAVFWRGRMKYPISFKEDFPIFAVFILFHLADILFAITAGYTDVLWLVVLASVIHIGLLAVIVGAGRKANLPETEFILGS